MRFGFVLLICAGWLAACGGKSDKPGGSNTVAGAGGGDAAIDGASGEGGSGDGDGDPGDGDGDGDPGDGDGDGDPGDGDGDGDAGMPLVCGDAPIVVTRADQVMLLIDGGTSMLEVFGGEDGGGRTRWDTLRDALFDASGVVPALEQRLRIGMAIYSTEPTCPLPLANTAPALGNAAALQAAFPMMPPGNLTPTSFAITDTAGLLQSTAQDTTIVVITDSPPSPCDGIFADQQLWAETEVAITNSVSAGFKLRVIAVGESPAADQLQRWANLGVGLAADDPASAPFGVASDLASLRSAIRAALEQDAGCGLQLNASVDADHACEGIVAIDGTVLPCATGNGWRLTSPTRIELEGEACAMLRGDPSAVVAASFPCSALAQMPGSCGGDQDCGPDLPFCSDDARCVKCVGDGQCGEGEACRNDVCVVACAQSIDCGGATPYCNEDIGECVGCLSDTNCGAGATPICASDTGRCVGCEGPEDCASTAPVCNPASRTCVECMLPADCGSGFDCTNNACVPTTSCGGGCNQPCFPVGVLACCRTNGTCGCTWAPGGQCI